MAPLKLWAYDMSRGEAGLRKDDPSIAGVRFVERETERKESQAEPRHLESRQEGQQLAVEWAMIQVMQAELREILRRTDTKAKQGLPQKLVV
jgi:hypothetical protein